MTEVEALHEEVAKLKERNKKVESNKAWETSLTRKLSIAGLTYIVIATTLHNIGNPAPLIHAIIPTLGFVLSTLSLPYVRAYWEKHIYKK